MRMIKEVEPGDEVFALDQDSQEIVVPRGRRGLLRREGECSRSPPGGRVIGASANHPFLVLRDERKPGRRRGAIAAMGRRSKSSSR